LRHAADVRVEIDRFLSSIPVEFAGRHAEYAGLDQVNVKLPIELRGTVGRWFRLVADGAVSNWAFLPVK
jgi:uncharacterized protein (TIGR03437 family)